MSSSSSSSSSANIDSSSSSLIKKACHVAREVTEDSRLGGALSAVERWLNGARIDLRQVLAEVDKVRFQAIHAWNYIYAAELAASSVREAVLCAIGSQDRRVHAAYAAYYSRSVYSSAANAAIYEARCAFTSERAEKIEVANAAIKLVEDWDKRYGKIRYISNYMIWEGAEG